MNRHENKIAVKPPRRSVICLLPLSVLIKRSTLVIVISLTCHYAFAQDYKDVIKGLQEKLKQAKNLHIVMKIQAFEDAHSTVAFYDEKADVKRKGTNYRYVFGHNEMLLNEKYLILVDKDLEQMVCSRRDLQSEKALTATFDMSLDSLLSAYGTPSLVKSNNGVSHFRLTGIEGLQYVDLYLSTQRYVPQSMEYFYTNNQRVIITFESFNVDVQMNEHEFSERNFIKIEKETVIPSNSFKQYAITTSW